MQAYSEPTSFSAADDGNLGCEERPEGSAYASCDRYELAVTNVGDMASSGPVTVSDVLPEGVTTTHPPGGESETFEWACETEESGSQELVRCRTEASIGPLSPAGSIQIPVSISPTLAAGSSVTSDITVSGGGGREVSTSQSSLIASPLAPAPAMPFEPLGFGFTLLTGTGAVDLQAASHLGGLATAFTMPTADSMNGFAQGTAPRPPIAPEPYPVENFKQVVTELPAGVIGDALVAPTCSLSQVSDLGQNPCPAASVVGRFIALEAKGGSYGFEGTIFNVPPEHGYAAEFVTYVSFVERPTFLYAKLVGSGPNARVRVTSAPIPNTFPIYAFGLTFFGDPAATDGGAVSHTAFATAPSDSAATGFTAAMYADTWQHPGALLPDGEPDLSDPRWKKAESTSPPVTGCEDLQFHPTFVFEPEPAHSQADEPAGYEATLKVPQDEEPNGLATPPLKTATVALPPGVAISPSAANGLVGCQESGPEGIELESDQPGHCPRASTIGSAKIVTPLLKEPLEGSVYVAQPPCSPCSEAQAEDGEVFSIYMEAGNENSGVHIKVKGKVEVGGVGQHSREVGLAPGQVRTTFAETPQQPFSELKLDFHGGARGPLANPQTCGTYTTNAELEPWSHTPAPGEKEGTPNTTVEPTFAITGDCGNGFAPSFSAGTTNPQAGAFSPFTLTFSRHDGEQDLGGVEVQMPPGLIGRIAGLQECPEEAANAGTCGTVAPGSRVGSATAAAGSGPDPFWQGGSVYLTGPYNGAPFGLSVVVPANAGPYHLGNIVVRAGIYIDPNTAQVTVKSNPLPQGVDGVPLRVQTVNVTVGEGTDFTFNPTNCGERSVGGALGSAQGASVAVASRFEAVNCAGLAFKPSFSASTQGNGSFGGNGASLDVKIATHEGPTASAAALGEANMARVEVELPKVLPSRLSTLQKACTEKQFAANPAGCPAPSDVGTATVSTPALPVPLTGPAYLVSHGSAAFPDLEMVLQGDNVTIVLDGHTQIKNGVTHSRFETVPDAPVSSFELKLPEEQYSVLSATQNLCRLTSTKTETKRVALKRHGKVVRRRGRVVYVKRKVKVKVAAALTMPTKITAQNGAVLTQQTRIAVSGCAKSKPAKQHKSR